MEKAKNLYDYWVEFITYIVGSTAPEAIYVISFVLFLILFFGIFLRIIKLMIGVWLVIIVGIWFVLWITFKVIGWF